MPEPPDEAITQPGDLWILGDHRLLCGDSSKPEDVDRLLDGATIHLVNTDPPYNVKVEPRSNNAIAAGLSVRSRAPRITRSSTSRGIPEKSKPTQQEAAGQGPAAGQRLRDRRGVRPAARRLVRQHGPRAGARPRVLHLGRLRQLRQLPAGPEGDASCTSRQAIIWDKQHPVLTRKDFMGSHEWCFYGWQEGAAHQFFGPNNATDLWHVKKVNPQRWSI